MYQKDEDFRRRIENGKGFCIPHFGDLCEAMNTKLPDKEKESFYRMLCDLEKKNLDRLYEDVSWLIENLTTATRMRTGKFQGCRTARHAEIKGWLPRRPCL